MSLQYTAPLCSVRRVVSDGCISRHRRSEAQIVYKGHEVSTDLVLGVVGTSAVQHTLLGLPTLRRDVTAISIGCTLLRFYYLYCIKCNDVSNLYDYFRVTHLVPSAKN